MDTAGVRELLPGVRDYAYFQTSGHSLKPEPVLDEVTRWMRLQAQGPALPAVSREMERVIERTRERVAALIHATPDEIMLNENATVGINLVANGIDWQIGDNVVLTSDEHPGNRLPWYNVARRYGVELRFVTPHADDGRFSANLGERIDARTRVVSVSHVSRQSGRRFPVAAIVQVAHRDGVPVLVDGAQAAGAIPVDVRVLGCDFYTLSGHKYLMGPQGTGAFFVRRDRLETLLPSWIGSRSQEAMDLTGHMRLRPSARRFEFGTRDWADLAGLGKALDLWQAIGWDRVFAGIADYTDRVKAAVSDLSGVTIATPLPYDRSSGIVTLAPAGLDLSSAAASLLAHERVVVSPVDGLVDGAPGIRVSCHVFNTEAELDRLVAGLQRLQRAASSAGAKVP